MIAFIVVQVYDLRMKLKVLDLFSGIGGFSLGLERTGGFETTQFVEQDPKAQLVLKKHWPDVKIHDDIRTFQPTSSFSADLVCGGFPCQDISSAGRGVGIVGERSGLWAEMARIIGVVRPKWVIAENVSALRSKGLALVLQDLSEIGYDAEWHCIPASAIGAPHRRDRVWIIASDVAHPERDGCAASPLAGGIEEAVRQESTGESNSLDSEGAGSLSATERNVAHTRRLQCHSGAEEPRVLRTLPADGAVDGNASGRGPTPFGGEWAVEPDVGRVAHGVPNRVDRLKQLGNAIVPQLATLIGYEILKKDIF